MTTMFERRDLLALKENWFLSDFYIQTRYDHNRYINFNMLLIGYRSRPFRHNFEILFDPFERNMQYSQLGLIGRCQKYFRWIL